MKQSQVKAAIYAAIAADEPLLILGEPGGGKSAISNQVGAALRVPMYDLRTAQLDAVDVRGVPEVVNHIARWATPEFIPAEGPGILVLEELPNATVAVQSALLELVQDRRVGKAELSKDIAILSTGNRVQDRAGAGRLISSLRDRFVSVQLDVDVADWVAWALDNGICNEVISFIRLNNELLANFDPQKDVSASPRSWEKVSRLLPHLSSSIRLPMCEGTVGESAATAFIGYLSVYATMPDPDVVLLNPQNAAIPDDPAVLYALCGAIARKASSATADRIFQYASRLAAEFSIVTVTDALRKDEQAMRSTRAFPEWATENQDVLVA